MADASPVTGQAPAAARGSNGTATPEEHFQELYRELGADAGTMPTRTAALEELVADGFPLRHDEEWAHTPVRAVVEQKYRLGTDERAHAPGGWTTEAVSKLLAEEPVKLLTMNGIPVIRAPAGPTDLRRASVLREAPDRPADGAALFTRPVDTAFTRLARAFGSCHELRLDAAAGDGPVHLVHLAEAGVLSAPRVRVRVAAGARVTLVETFAEAGGGPEDDAPSLTCGDTEIHLGAGAALTYVRVQAAAAEAFDLGSTTVVQERDSELHALSVAAGARLARHTLNVLAAGPGVSSRLGGAAVAGGAGKGGARQVIDNHTYLEHAAPNCSSRQLYKMVLGGGGHGVFSGRILVRPAAQQTDAFQLNRNLLLDDAVIDTKPQLEIGADDVRCTHGATTGRLNEDQMFYLQTRGIPRPAAGQMLARGFLDEVVSDLPAAALRPRLLDLLHGRLDRLAWSPPV